MYSTKDGVGICGTDEKKTNSKKMVLKEVIRTVIRYENFYFDLHYSIYGSKNGLKKIRDIFIIEKGAFYCNSMEEDDRGEQDTNQFDEISSFLNFPQTEEVTIVDEMIKSLISRIRMDMGSRLETTNNGSMDILHQSKEWMDNLSFKIPDQISNTLLPNLVEHSKMNEIYEFIILRLAAFRGDFEFMVNWNKFGEGVLFLTAIQNMGYELRYDLTITYGQKVIPGEPSGKVCTEYICQMFVRPVEVGRRKHGNPLNPILFHHFKFYWNCITEEFVETEFGAFTYQKMVVL